MNRLAKAVRGNIVAWIALFVALGGTSLAARHYLITSTRQIKPSVLKKLRGASGRTGATGPRGAPGSQGSAGAQGPNGQSALVPLPARVSESGDFEATNGDGTQKFVTAQVTFQAPLSAPLDFEHYVYQEGTPVGPQCTGPGQAAPGYLCVYAFDVHNVTFVKTHQNEEEAGPFERPAIGRFGFGMSWTVNAIGAEAVAAGTWTVTSG